MYEQIDELDIIFSSHQGKVRDIHDLGDKLLIVTSDRISAFDVVFPDPLGPTMPENSPLPNVRLISLRAVNNPFPAENLL